MPLISKHANTAVQFIWAFLESLFSHFFLKLSPLSIIAIVATICFLGLLAWYKGPFLLGKLRSFLLGKHDGQVLFPFENNKHISLNLKAFSKAVITISIAIALSGGIWAFVPNPALHGTIIGKDGIPKDSIKSICYHRNKRNLIGEGDVSDGIGQVDNRLPSKKESSAICYAVSNDKKSIELTDFDPDNRDNKRRKIIFPNQVEKIIFFDKLLFESDRDDLSKQAIATLEKALQVIIANPRARVILAGHADIEGSDRYNMELTKRRVQSALNYLKHKITSFENVIPGAFGERDQIDPTSLPKNRRLEIIIFRPHSHQIGVS